jgi:hypothetical protein
MDRASFVLAGALLLSGCAVEIPGTDSVGDGDSSGGDGTGSSSDPAGGKLSSNGLALDMEILSELDSGPLGVWQSETEAVVDPDSLAIYDEAAGPEHLEYLALCALDQGTEMVIGASRYPGLFGLAPEWIDSGCSDSCQRWVSACLLAHANHYGLAVTVSLRGAHTGLAWDAAIAEEFTLQEAAFYGNIFQVDDDDVIDPERPLYACSGRALIAWDEDPEHQESSLDYLQKRICGTGAACGLNHTGPCVYPPFMTESICRQDAGWEGYYANCEGESLDDPLEGPPVYPEVITTYLVEE